MVSRLDPNFHSTNYSATGSYLNGTVHSSEVAILSPASSYSITVHTPSEKEVGNFRVDFLMGGIVPIERVKNQDKMMKSGWLSEPYKRIGDCFALTMKDEGVISLWRGNTANVIRYFLTQALNFAFKKDKVACWKCLLDLHLY